MLEVEANHEKGLTKVLEINVEGWIHLQVLDYKELPFKCNNYHAYGNFDKKCPKYQVEQPPLLNDRWNLDLSRVDVKTHNTRVHSIHIHPKRDHQNPTTKIMKNWEIWKKRKNKMKGKQIKMKKMVKHKIPLWS